MGRDGDRVRAQSPAIQLDSDQSKIDHQKKHHRDALHAIEKVYGDLPGWERAKSVVYDAVQNGIARARKGHQVQDQNFARLLTFGPNGVQVGRGTPTPFPDLLPELRIGASKWAAQVLEGEDGFQVDSQREPKIRMSNLVQQGGTRELADPTYTVSYRRQT